MLPVNGLHHVTSLAGDAQRNNDFFTKTLGLRRVKKTVNFDAPDVYHLYYGDEIGTPGTVMTHFPFQNAAPGTRGTGEAGEISFSVPPGSLGEWETRLADHSLVRSTAFGAGKLAFTGPDGDGLALVEAEDDRAPWTGQLSADLAIRGFHSVRLVLTETEPTRKVLEALGFLALAEENGIVRMAAGDGGPGYLVDLEARPDLPAARQSAGSVHHVAFRVADRAAQDEVRDAMSEIGMKVTPSIDRDYFRAIYFRSPGGVLFEVATDEPGFTRDEDVATLGTALKLPEQHAHLRDQLEAGVLPTIRD
ncbi:ring-cleaving dioxygenase [Roseicyclus sp. F158]|uniref:Ring-cleaving dioxygenase n=1 Tax=Tropicimonas omnivorans TaxID=3075590 RepID=A0ABU3DBV4_9RHOB|nr:ring-cleaving dioxygenase [Roseicyclus sp. F158]MDT0681191.1 ring-cleaving dioxygenase [Roseicyclus sp. F158]